MEFPPPWLARPDGLLCIGGDLSTERLIQAYKSGIFPWFSENEPILWWSPDPRLVLFPKNVYVSRSLKKKLRRNTFHITLDSAFEKVISACALPRKKDNSGTWLVQDMIEAYIELHHNGFAHSVEVWQDGRLVGGLYGISLGYSFFGESMFSFISDASKAALVTLAGHLAAHDFDFIDCQVTTDHLLNMGAVEIPRQKFLQILQRSISRTPDPDMWNPDLWLSQTRRQNSF